MEPLDSNNPNVVAQYEAIIKTILREIEIKNVSITQFCEDNALNADEFLDSLSNIREDFSYYLDIIESLKNY